MQIAIESSGDTFSSKSAVVRQRSSCTGSRLNSFQWRGVIPRLAGHRRCIAPDFMTLGYTETAENHEISPATQAEMLAEFLDALRIKTADVVANDTRGEVAQLFVARYRKRARSLLLSNCDVDTNNGANSLGLEGNLRCRCTQRHARC